MLWGNTAADVQVIDLGSQFLFTHLVKLGSGKDLPARSQESYLSGNSDRGVLIVTRDHHALQASHPGYFHRLFYFWSRRSDYTQKAYERELSFDRIAVTGIWIGYAIERPIGYAQHPEGLAGHVGDRIQYFFAFFIGKGYLYVLFKDGIAQIKHDVWCALNEGRDRRTAET